MFHNSVVDGDIRSLRESRRVEAREAEIGTARVDRRTSLSQNVGRQILEVLQKSGGVEHKNPAVPVIAAILNIGAGDLGDRLLAELLDLEDALRSVDRSPFANVAVASVGRSRLDAEENMATCQGHRTGPSHRVLKQRLVPDEVVGWHHHDHGGRALACGQHGGHRDRRRRVARHGLKYNRGLAKARFLGFLLNQEAVIAIAEDDGSRESGGLRQTGERCAQEARLSSAEQRQELLGKHRPGQGPKPRARAPRKDDRNDVGPDRCIKWCHGGYPKKSLVKNKYWT